MKKTYLPLIFAALTLFLSACTTHYEPAPIGDKIVWTNVEEGRPDWTVDAPDNDDNQDSYTFVGQSRFHSTEKSARASAEADAIAHAAKFLEQNAILDYRETANGSSADSGIQDANVSISDSVQVKADEFVKRVTIEEWYLENWVRDSKYLWKAYVKVKLPKGQETRRDIEKQSESQKLATKENAQHRLQDEAREIREFNAKTIAMKTETEQSKQMSAELQKVREGAVKN